MLDFRLDEEQKMLTDAIKRLSAERIRKHFRDAEEDRAIPADLTRACWELGLLPTMIPEAYGGFGEYSAVTGVVALEEFAWGDLAVTLDVMTPNLVAIPVMLAGTEAQKEGHLPLFCEESLPPVSAAITEHGFTFDPRNLKTTAVLDGDDYILNGTKMMVPRLDSAEVVLVYASENGVTQAFFVPIARDGITVGAREKLMGVNALPLHRLNLENVRIPAENKLGGDAGIDFNLILAHSRVALGALAVGMARAGYEYARDYAKQRVQFGEPVAHRQSIAFLLAEMATDIDEARLLVWEAAWLLDQGQDALAETTVMKLHIDKMVLKAGDNAVQVLGGYGYIREYPVELYFRNARGFVNFDGLAII